MAYTSLSAAYHILYQNEKAIEYFKFFEVKESDKVREEAALIF